MRKFGVAVVSLLLACTGVWTSSAVPARAVVLAEPTYQIKLKLSSAAVGADGSPSSTFRDHFSVIGKDGVERSRYFDTEDLFYLSHGWSIRIRSVEGNDSLDVTFKYRQPLDDNSLSKATVGDSLERARRDNFDSSDSNYKAQVNTSFSSSTLDFSNKKSTSCLDPRCTVPLGDGANALISKLEPGKMVKATGISSNLLDLNGSPEVEQTTWRVEIGGLKTDLEVSTFGEQRWVEVSEDETSRTKAISKRDTLISELTRAHLLAPEDAFKTEPVLRAAEGAVDA